MSFNVKMTNFYLVEELDAIMEEVEDLREERRIRRALNDEERTKYGL